MYTREEKLTIYGRIGVTKEAYDILRKQKRHSKFSMAKLASNLIIKSADTQTLPIQKPPVDK